MAQSSTTAWDLTVWQHLRLEHPATWELLRYSCKEDVGRCTFFDRDQPRLEFNWRRVAGRPDHERMLSDYAAKLETEEWRHIERQGHGNWLGLSGEKDGLCAVRFGRHVPELSCLVELVFLWPGRRQPEIERRVLDAAVSQPARDGCRRWRAWGLDVRVPEAARLLGCRRECAHTELAFALADGLTTYRFTRLGMVADWLRGELAPWLRGRVPAGAELLSTSTDTRDGHSVCSVTARLKRRIQRGRVLRPIREFAAWRCPADGRLYIARRTGPAPRGNTPPAPLAGMLACAAHGFDSPPGGTGLSGPPVLAASQPRAGGMSWSSMLRARAVRNRAAEVRAPRAGDGIVVHVPRQSVRSLRVPLSWIVPANRERKVVLDALGRGVFDLCDAHRTVEDIVDAFAAAHHLTFHEARISVTQYLRELIRRGVCAIEVPEV